MPSVWSFLPKMDSKKLVKSLSRQSKTIVFGELSFGLTRDTDWLLFVCDIFNLLDYSL